MNSSIFSVSTLIVLLGFLIPPGMAQDSWDWHIEKALIVDGTGAEAFRADLLIRGEQIGYIGEVDPDTISAENRVDAAGRVVTPGFIDVHAHGNPLQTPAFENFLAMGVTTILLGQDGSSSAVGSLENRLERIEAEGPGPNIATLSGHGSIRSRAGVGKHVPTDMQLREMAELLRSDLEDGAFGMSLGLEYVPGMYAQEQELRHLAGIMGDYNGIIMSHMRSEDDADIENSLDELAALGKRARVHASHLKVVYGEGADRAEEILVLINEYRKKGITFTADTYPYTASYTGISILFPSWAKTRSGWKQAVSERPDELKSFLEDKIEQRNGPGAILFGSGNFTGQTLAEAARRQGMAPADLLMEVGPEAGYAAHFVMNAELQDRIIVDKNVMISSDGSPTMRHPRSYGSFAKIISRYVQEQQMLTLEEAIYKMSGMSAETLQITDRGKIKEGYKADLLIFNPEEVRDTATFEEPYRLAEGFDWVMVNGKLVRETGDFTGKRNGHVLRREAK